MKKKSVWIFSSWMGKKIIDNPLHFYLWMKENRKQVRCIWIVKDNSLADENSDIYFSLSPKGIYYQFIASVCICSHSIYSDFNPLILLLRRSIYKVQLWHGAPLKKIMSDVQIGLFKAIKQVLYDRYDLVLSPGPKFTNVIQNAFKVRPSQVVTGKSPRIQPKSKNANFVLYAPTFRDGKDYNYFNNLDFTKLDQILRKINKMLLIRLHPSIKAKQNVKDKVECFDNIQIDETEDVYDILPHVSILISDYSGIIFDFLHYKRPIIYAPFDLEEYVSKTRGVYFDYDDISVRPLAYSWDEICIQLKDINSYDYSRLNLLNQLYCCNEDSVNDALFERINSAVS